MGKTSADDDMEASYAFEMWAAAGFDLPSIDAFLADARLPPDIRDHLLETRQESLQDYASGRFDLAVAKFETLHARCLYYGQNLAVAPNMRLVEKFKGRGRGKGPVRKLIAGLLAKNPTMKNAAIWDEIRARPPRGYTALQNRVGRYIEGPTPGENMDYGRFLNVCSQERKALKGS